MKKTVLILTLALLIGFAFSLTVSAQVVRTTKKTYKIGKRKTVIGVRKTNNGLHKGWYKGKRVGQKSWYKGKRISVKSYRKGKKITVKGIKKVKD